MINNEIYGIFPTPIYVSKIDRKLTDNELEFVFENKKYFCKNDSNIVTENKYILNEKIFLNLKKEINLKISDYFLKIICTSNNIEPYITQSWINYTEKNQYHTRHNHPNSILSGVFYINCDEKFDKIVFFKDKYETIKLEIEQWNLWNSDSWIFDVKPGDIILFPSHLKHMVETTKSDKTRISLAFNVFIRGQIGKKEFSSELILT
jgi:uncharacterized protein (TIGR02466 family)